MSVRPGRARCAVVGLRGRVVDRVHRGRLGPEGAFSRPANASPARLTRPLFREGGRLMETNTLIKTLSPQILTSV
ncbi:hypothetical protein [Streptomyces virginiae]|uniref:hypothetical protein n=1 Tax=Streptomyces virginiae TaxID=1961 RepID=UPI0036F8D809